MDVGVWLRGLGLGKYEEKFRDNAIDADLLPRLTVDDLKDIGVSVVGDRRRLLDAIASLAGAKPADILAPPPKPALPAGPQVSAERRPITVMFCDLVGSTGLAARLDAEDWRNLVNAYLDAASKAVTNFGGHVLKRLGDGLMALFGYPAAQENDAERAVRAALGIQRALADLNAQNAAKGTPELKARIGIESGPVVVEANGEVFGDAPNVAARVEAAAEPGSVLVTANVQRQTAGLFVAEDAGAHELKGVAAPVQLFRIVRASGGGRRGGARALTPFVGREEELAMLARRWQRALSGEGQLVLIVGEPGLGKSRLVEEFHAQLNETPHTWSVWGASQLLQNTPLHPIAEWGRARFGADSPADGRLADLEGTLRLVGLDPDEHAPLLAPLVDIPLPPERAADFPPEELRKRQMAAMTAWVLAGARSQAVVLAFEDLHWADPTSLDLLCALAERGHQAPMLVLATARPEFRPPWSLRSHHSVVSLAPLDRAQVARMVNEISARHALASNVIAGVSERTGGVPLFVEEVTRLLLERGEQGGAQAIPLTLQQSLAARLDRLGPAREIAQIGAVLGRAFSYGLLRSVTALAERGTVGGVGDPALQARRGDGGLSEAALQSALDRLAEADLLFAEGAPPEASYRFKHALIQDAAYDSLLKSRRQALHRRAAEALLAAPDPQPEVVAHHFTEARLDDLAVEWWGKAGDQALRRSAFQEAIAHLGKAIAMADKAGGGGAGGPSGERRQLHAAYGNALMQARGYGAPETTEAFARARESAAGENDAPDRLAADYGLWVGSYVRGELSSMRAHAAAFISDVGARPVSPEAGVAHRAAGMTHWFAGEYREAREHLEQALSLFQAGRDDDLAFRLGQDAGVAAMLNLAIALWPLGEVDRAASLFAGAQARSASVTHVGTRALGKTYAALFALMRGSLSRAAPSVLELAQLTREHELPFFEAYGVFFEGLTRAESSVPSGGLEAMRRGAQLLREQNVLIWDGLIKIGIAEAEARAGDVARALAVLDEALATCERIGHRTFEAELHRTRGDILLKRDPADPAPAEDAYRTAIAVAKRQGARSHELLASLSLAKLHRATGRPVEAHAVLGPALEGIAPTPEMPEIAEALALLEELSQTEEVKVVTAQRKRLTQLHAAYGNALIAARGHGAPETMEAFARARKSASGNEDAPGRLAADYGLWVGSYVRGDLPSMRTHAAAFLAGVAASPDSPEAGVAHRVVGTTHCFAGEYAEAREHLECALTLFQPGRDDDLAFRFGQDAGVAAMCYLAIASWPLGNVRRAVSLVDGAHGRLASVAHIGTHPYAKLHAAMFELMRGDRARAAENGSEAARLAREHDLPLWRAYGAFFEGLATAERGALGEGLSDMRRRAESLRQQDLLNFDGLFKITLADVEARAGDRDRAIAILDEALATADRLGYRAFEAELHRARGETLLRRDPANPAPAEDAFLTAIAVAERQGTRSFELRAALALAKLYQATGRPADAHAVLAPALDGFSPTPEMPEIAEAQALLATLAEKEEVKTAVAQGERRLQLQTAYSQAVMLSKGYAAEETKDAFDRARELAGGTKTAADRFPGYFAQWVRSLARGEHRQAQRAAESFLREAEEGGYATEAGVARRCLGASCYYQGKLLEARTHLQRALAEYWPDRDAQTRFRFGHDTRILATANLVPTTWHLGQVERARQLAEQAVQSATELGHVPSTVFAHAFKTGLEILRDDPAAALRSAETLLALAREHGMEFFVSAGEAYAGWARGRLDDPQAGARIIRRALAEDFKETNRINAPLFHGLLADLEAATRGPDAALTVVDQGLAAAQETGECYTDPYLYRLRGEVLFRRDPANPVFAEEAFQTAIAIAKEQGARSPVLLASLALAKLYRSTGRPTEAHAVLAPALEGFAPTPEMPEIAEGQALLERFGREGGEAILSKDRPTES